MKSPLLDISYYDQHIATFSDDWTLVPFTGKFAPLGHSNNSYTRFSAFTQQKKSWAFGALNVEASDDDGDSFAPPVLDKPRENHAKLRVRKEPDYYGPSDVIHKVRKTWREVREELPFDPEIYAKYRVAIFARSNRSRTRFNTWSPGDKCAPNNMERYLSKHRPVDKKKKMKPRHKNTVHEPQVDFASRIPVSISQMADTFSNFNTIKREHFFVLFQCYYLARNISTSHSEWDVAMHAANFFQHYPGTFNSDALAAMCVSAYSVLPKFSNCAAKKSGTLTTFLAAGGNNDNSTHEPQVDSVVLDWLSSAWNTHGPTRSTMLCALAAFILCVYFKQTSSLPLDFPEVTSRLQSVFVDLTDYASWWEFFRAAQGYVVDAYASWRSGTLIPFLTSGDYGAFRKRVAVLRIQNETLGSMESRERILYSAELYNLKTLGDQIKKRLSLTSAATKVTTLFKWMPTFTGEGALCRDIETLLSLQLAFEAELRSARNRRAPLGVLITGSSSIGKSAVSDYLIRYFGALHDLPQGSEYRFTMNGSSTNEFMSGYNLSKWAVAMDDIGAIKSKFQPDGDPMCKLLIDAINNVPYITNQADLGSKGTVPFMAELVIVTSNVKDFGAPLLFNTPEAVLRRLEYVITPMVVPEYSKDGALDRSRAAAYTTANPKAFPPFWTFKVELVHTKPIPRDTMGRPAGLAKAYAYDEVSGPDGFTGAELLAHFKEYSVRHSDQQDVVNRGKPDIHICPHGLPSCVTCEECDPDVNDPQSDELPDGAPIWDAVVTPVAGYFNAFNSWLLALNTLFMGLFCLTFFLRFRIYEYFERQRAETFMRRWTTINAETKRKVELASASLVLGIGALQLYYYVTKPVDVTHADDGIPTTSGCESFAPWDAGFSAAPTIRSGFPNAASSATGASHSAVLDKKLEEALKRVIIIKDVDASPATNPCHCHGLMVGDKVLLINTHSLTNGAPCGAKMRVTISGTPSQHPGHAGSTNAITGLVPLRNRYEIPGTPYTLLYLPFSSLYKNIIPFFLLADAQPGHAAEHWRWIDRTVDNTSVINRAFSRGTRPSEWRSLPPHNERYDSWAATGSDDAIEPFVKGHSGSLWLSRQPSGVRGIIGLHEGVSTTMTAHGKIVYSQTIPLPQHVLRDGLAEIIARSVACPTLSEPQNAELAIAMTNEAADDPFLGPQHESAPVHHKFAGNFLHLNDGVDLATEPFQYDLLYGSLGHRAKFTTSFQDSLMRLYWEALGYTTEKVPPVLERGKKWLPEQIYFKAATMNRSSLLDPDDLRDCANSFIQHVFDKLPSDEMQYLQPYNREVAINGQEGIRYVDPLNMSSGTGHGYKGTKRGLFNPVTDNAIAALKLFHARVDYIEQEWAAGRLVSPVYTSCLKDEPISLAKQRLGKIRVFSMSPVDATVAARQFLLSYCRVAQRNPFVFEQAVGMNCHSSGWGNIARYLHAMGGDNRQAAGDYAQFDCALQAALLDEVRRYFLCLFSLSGNYGPKALKSAACAIADIINPTCDFFGTFVGLHGLNPTGNMLTVHVNGIGNSLLLRLVFVLISKRQTVPIPVSEFRNHVSPITYGDDHVLGVAETVPWFHQNSIATGFATLNIGYTDAHKRTIDEGFPDYEAWDDITFLKRRFIWSEELGEYLAPLDTSVFGKMLCLARIKNVNEHDSAAASLLAFVYEQFHHGREAYDEACCQAVACTAKFGLPVHEYPVYDARMTRFHTTSATLHPYTEAEFLTFLNPGTKIPPVGNFQFANEGYTDDDSQCE